MDEVKATLFGVIAVVVIALIFTTSTIIGAGERR